MTKFSSLRCPLACVAVARRARVPRGASRGSRAPSVARFDFDELCARETGAADFAALAARFDAVVLSRVPRLSALGHNEARRFITLVDELYEARALLVCSAAARPAELFSALSPEALAEAAAKQARGGRGAAANPFGTDRRGGPGAQAGGARGGMSDLPERVAVDAADDLSVLEGELASVQELGFAFARAASRLVEMQSVEYERDHARERTTRRERARRPPLEAELA